MINTIVLGGRVVREPELKYMNDGSAFLKFSIANEVGWGERKKTNFIDCAKFGKGTEGLSQYIHKGDMIHVRGQISSRSHEGKTYVGINVDEVALAPKPRQEQGETQGGNVDEDTDAELPF